jgi:hypothetical protein
MDRKGKKERVRNSSTKKKNLVAEKKLYIRGAKKSAVDSIDGKTERQRRTDALGKERKANERKI